MVENRSLPLSVRGLTKTSSSRSMSRERVNGGEDADNRLGGGAADGRTRSDSEYGRSGKKTNIR